MAADQNIPFEVEYPDGSTRELALDESSNIKSIKVTDLFKNVILDHRYEYDECGNIVAKNTATGDYLYRYDAFSRLTEVIKGGLTVEKYAYDESGNRLSSAATDDWKYGPDNQLLGYGKTAFEYDSRGNTVKMTGPGENQNYIYDAEDRLIEVRDDAGRLIAKYSYDEQGRRIKKEVFQSDQLIEPVSNPSPQPHIEPVEMGTEQNPLIEPVEISTIANKFIDPIEVTPPNEITHYHYSDEGVLLKETDAQGNEITIWAYDPYCGLAAAPLFMKHKGKRYVFHNDHLGTPQKITDAKGNIVWSATYNAFGMAEIDPVSTITGNLRFPGQYYDSETGLHYNIHRYYNPATGRYLSKDPLKVVAEGSNLYSYANANPLKFYDHLGLYDHPRHRKLFRMHFPKLKDSFFESMMAGSDNVDKFKYQGASYSYVHWMKHPDLSMDQWYEYVRHWIKKNLDEIKELKTAKEFFCLGQILHLFQDSTSTMHSDKNGLPRPYGNSKHPVPPNPMDPASLSYEYIPFDAIPKSPVDIEPHIIAHVILENLYFDNTKLKIIFREYENKLNQYFKQWNFHEKLVLIKKVAQMTQKGSKNFYTTETREECEKRILQETISGE